MWLIPLLLASTPPSAVGCGAFLFLFSPALSSCELFMKNESLLLLLSMTSAPFLLSEHGPDQGVSKTANPTLTTTSIEVLFCLFLFNFRILTIYFRDTILGSRGSGTTRNPPLQSQGPLFQNRVSVLFFGFYFLLYFSYIDYCSCHSCPHCHCLYYSNCPDWDAMPGLNAEIHNTTGTKEAAAEFLSTMETCKYWLCKTRRMRRMKRMKD